ncbi:hypothetical protein PybrP1_004299 [[Pythium] brassicae (nom. inval.)]|nr:hypothetical protein PybrP1_004299 [[Pythium] brassicae (nom. inval.)]
MQTQGFSNRFISEGTIFEKDAKTNVQCKCENHWDYYNYYNKIVFDQIVVQVDTKSAQKAKLANNVDLDAALKPLALAFTGSVRDRGHALVLALRAHSRLPPHQHATPDERVPDLDATRRMAEGKQPVVFLDYDGTLSPIVDVPDHAFMSDAMRGALRALSDKFVTAIVTGRSTEKVYGFVQLDKLVYAGSHGFDIKGPASLPINCQVGDHFRPVLEQSTRSLADKLADIPGAEIEDNCLSVSVHYRHVAPALQSRVESVVDAYVALLPSLVKKHDKKVFELRPRLDWDKGRAVLFILSQLGMGAENMLPFYPGDDVSDEDAFTALNARGSGRGVSIIVRGPEATTIDLPGNSKGLPATTAAYSLRNTLEVERFLTAPTMLGDVVRQHKQVAEQDEMALRVVLRSTRALSAASVRAPAARYFSAEVSKEEAEAAAAAALAAEDALAEKLKKQQLEDAARTILPYHASEEAIVTLGESNIPYPKEMALISGTGDFTVGRKAHIFMPARHQMQSGTYNTRHWEIRFDSPRTWQNPLMGWTSTADAFHGMVLKFDKKEDAVGFAEKQGWEVEVEEPAEVGNFDGEISYAYNFLPQHIDVLLKREGKKAHVQFKHPTGRRSNWVKTLKYHGNGVVAQHGGEAKE